MVAKWTRRHPIEAHLITIISLLIVMGVLVVIFIHRYGDRIDKALIYSRGTYERVIELTESKDTIQNE